MTLCYVLTAPSHFRRPSSPLRLTSTVWTAGLCGNLTLTFRWTHNSTRRNLISSAAARSSSLALMPPITGLLPGAWIRFELTARIKGAWRLVQLLFLLCHMKYVVSHDVCTRTNEFQRV